MERQLHTLSTAQASTISNRERSINPSITLVNRRVSFADNYPQATAAGSGYVHMPQQRVYTDNFNDPRGHFNLVNVQPQNTQTW